MQTAIDILGLPDRSAALKAGALDKLAALAVLKEAIHNWETSLLIRANSGRYYTDEDAAELAFYETLTGVMDDDRTVQSYIDDKRHELGMVEIEPLFDPRGYDNFKMAEGR